MNSLAVSLLQLAVLLVAAPYSVGLVRWFKARLQGRKGANPILVYITLATLLRKQMVISKTTSWVFRLVPFVVLTSSVFLVLVLPLVSQGGMFARLSDFVIVAGVLAMGAVFLVLGGLDSSSAFGGMGASREMTISSLLEPAIIVTFGTFALVSEHADLDGMLSAGGMTLLSQPYLFLSLAALFMILFAENARYPVDNPATHLELTMVHEAMVLEYSGPYLALLEYASALKLTVFLLLIANMIFPVYLLTPNRELFAPVTLVTAFAGTAGKLIVMTLVLALWESLIAKMRFYRMQEYLSAAFFIGLAGLVLSLMNFFV